MGGRGLWTSCYRKMWSLGKRDRCRPHRKERRLGKLEASGGGVRGAGREAADLQNKPKDSCYLTIWYCEHSAFAGFYLSS